MRYVLAVFLSFTLGTAMAYKFRYIEPEKVYTEIPLKLYTSYDGIHWGFKEK